MSPIDLAALTCAGRLAHCPVLDYVGRDAQPTPDRPYALAYRLDFEAFDRAMVAARPWHPLQDPRHGELVLA